MSRLCHVHCLGLIAYERAWKLQHILVNERQHSSDLPDTLLLLEHPPVYTLGTGSSLQYLKFEPDSPIHPIHRVERGGEVTYHCPGQIVGYPILNLNYHHKDLHWYLRQLESLIIETLKIYGLPAVRRQGVTGVWLDGRKIASVGIKVSRWITMHGFAINVNADLTGFEHIIPCGLQGEKMTNMSQFIPEIQIEQVRSSVIEEFARVFELDCLINSSGDLLELESTH